MTLLQNKKRPPELPEVPSALMGIHIANAEWLAAFQDTVFNSFHRTRFLKKPFYKIETSIERSKKQNNKTNFHSSNASIMEIEGKFGNMA